MIVGNLEHAERYQSLHPAFEKLFEFVKSTDFNRLPLGRVDIDGDNLFVMNLELNGVDAEAQPLEMHRRYIDVHILLGGSEEIGWKAVEDVERYSQDYSAEGDCALSPDAPAFYAKLRPGQFMAVWTEDAHAPGVDGSHIRKLIGKVKI